MKPPTLMNRREVSQRLLGGLGLLAGFGALATTSGACASAAPTEGGEPAAPKPAVSPDTARVPTHSPPPEPEPAVTELKRIAPGEVVPAFELTAEDGTVLDSRELVGKKPFMLVFFASWCRVCERKLPEVKAAIEQAGQDLLIIGVALDNAETWPKVAPYIEKHAIGDFKLVRGQENRKFAVAYNPFGSVPIVEVIDRTGIIAELQRGWKPGHQDKLTAALEHVNANMAM